MKDYKQEKVNNANGGFSLVEVIIAIVVLALIAVPLLNYFTESIKQSARMARKQQATLLAQELTESMKAESQLIQYDAGNFTAPILTDPDPDGYGLTMSVDPAYDSFRHDGLGMAVFDGGYSGTNGDFDLQVTLNTNVASNDPTMPAAFGINNNTDALAVESDQLNTALVYFRTIHNNYCGANPGTPLLSQDEVKSALSRKIYIDVDYDTVANKFGVSAHYEYTCDGVAGVDPADVFSSTALVNVHLNTIKNVYLLYDCMESVAHDSITLNISPDALHEMALFKEAPDDADTERTKMGLYLVAQGVPASGYTVTVDGVGAAVSSTYMVNVHSNIESPNTVENNVGTVRKPLTSSLTPVRLVSITTQVFPAGHAAGDEALATMTTTKGEQP